MIKLIKKKSLGCSGSLQIEAENPSRTLAYIPICMASYPRIVKSSIDPLW